MKYKITNPKSEILMKLLIANRGEIALRIQRTAHRMGISTVAIYSKYDAESKHVLNADESVLLPGESLAETYLNINAILDAAKKTGATAIHPGYGFLSENPLFSEACEREGITFVGPSGNSIRAMGNKIAARQVAENLGVPITRGITGLPVDLLKNHAQVGFPMLIKAAAGGGGKGMRIVRSESELDLALETTSREALNYFGDGSIYIETFVENPRHIEVQVLGDKSGNMVHLFERECSAQRRHQKIIEESPSPTLTPEVRAKMCESAVKLASSIGYYSAGTIEFLVDNDLNYYFLEMNTRIQVEHPVTEMTTGIDIVEEQLHIAAGEPLRLKQDAIHQSGHSIECRIYAEDPMNNFIPSPGMISLYNEPSGSNIRVDSMEIEESGQIHSFFDPMIGKLITCGSDREEARALMQKALQSYIVQGIHTNISFLSGFMQHPDFIANNITTRYIDNNLDPLLSFTSDLKASMPKEIPLFAGMLHSLIGETEKATIWQTIGYWRHLAEPVLMLDDELFHLKLLSRNGSVFRFEFEGKIIETELAPGVIQSTIRINSDEYPVYISYDKKGRSLVTHEGYEYLAERPDVSRPENETLTLKGNLNIGSSDIVSPMPGKVIKINISEGDAVKKGQVLMIVEAMKMENNILCPSEGIVEKLLVKEGDMVDGSSRLVHLGTF